MASGSQTFLKPQTSCLLLISLVLGAPTALATTAGGSIQGTLFDPSGLPVNSNNVNFKIQIMDQAATCVLYQETHPGLDLSATNGDFSFDLGYGTSSTNFVSGGVVLNETVFRNDVNLPASPGCPTGLNFASGDGRIVRVQFDLGAGFNILAPDMRVQGGAYSAIAQTVQGKTPSDFVQIVNDGTTALTQANQNTIFSVTNFNKLVLLLSGTAPVNENGQRVINVGAPTASSDAVTRGYADSTVGGKNVDVSAVGTAAGNGDTLIWNSAQNGWIAQSPAPLAFPLLATPSGSSTAPAYSFAASPTTGFYSPALNQISLATAGSAAMTILDNGNVGIGTTSPGARTELKSSGGTGDAVNLFIRNDFLSAGANNSNLVLLDNVNGHGSVNSAVVFGGNGAKMFSLGNDANHDGSQTFYIYDHQSSRTDMFLDSYGRVALGGSTSPAGILDLNGTTANTSALIVPRAPTSVRPTLAVNGMLRYNTNNNQFEFFQNNTWVSYSTSPIITNCPTGFTLIGTAGLHGSFCISTAAQTPTTFFAAQAACEDLSVSDGSLTHLCTYAEWHKACRVGTLGMTGHYEWEDSLVNQNTGMVLGSAGCDDGDDRISSFTFAYRCCIGQ